ncbi:MAPEG family protein [Sphingobium sp. DEHP117]|uniref:MAPEG family protein n=1 Tax=Sphingobium sp. DEHP117 TaxID=2993436 RepID=UPI0027D581CF|nr:MAPEG family protein [Sphingobium sp. DEHP117]MDQ4419983.1 MAPEG family protein [Sphingobium sp. DEHP117]
MATELTILAWAGVLLLVHIFAAGNAKTKQYGVQWNVGPRDGELPPLSPVAGRLVRAQANYMETLPLAIIALAGVVIAGRASELTALAGWVWLGARVVYLPIYAMGIPVLRSVAFLVSLAALLTVLWPLIFG